jgi:hypothetical protein
VAVLVSAAVPSDKTRRWRAHVGDIGHKARQCGKLSRCPEPRGSTGINATVFSEA